MRLGAVQHTQQTRCTHMVCVAVLLLARMLWLCQWCYLCKITGQISAVSLAESSAYEHYQATNVDSKKFCRCLVLWEHQNQINPMAMVFEHLWPFRCWHAYLQSHQIYQNELASKQWFWVTGNSIRGARFITNVDMVRSIVHYAPV